jgi:hypothetical protein
VAQRHDDALHQLPGLVGQLAQQVALLDELHLAVHRILLARAMV